MSIESGFWHLSFFPERFWNNWFWQEGAIQGPFPLLRPGHWHAIFYPAAFWQENFWLDYGIRVYGNVPWVTQTDPDEKIRIVKTGRIVRPGRVEAPRITGSISRTPAIQDIDTPY